MCVSDAGPLYDKKRNLLTSDKLEMCTILLEQFISVFTTPLPNKQVTEPELFFSVESITSQDDEVFLTNIIITESIITDSIKELSSNYAAGPDEITASLLLNCASELAPSPLILFKQFLDSGVIDSSLKKPAIVPVYKSGRTVPSNIYYRFIYSPFSDRVGLPPHNAPFPGVLMKSIGAAFLRPDALPDVNHRRGMQNQKVLNITFWPEVN